LINLTFCPKCGSQVEEHYAVCPSCGAKLKGDPPEKRTATQHLSLAFNIASSKPIVFAPVILGGVISSITDQIAVDTPGFGALWFILSIIGSVIVFMLNFASTDMERNAYTDRPLDLMASMSYVASRFLTFLLASIVAAVLYITIILAPVAYMMMVVLVVDETGIGDALSKAFSVISSDLSDIIVLIILSILGNILLGWIPLVSWVLTACFGVIMTIAYIDVYEQHKRFN